MPDWTAFGAVSGLVLFLVLGLARVTTGAATGRYAGADEAAEVDPAGGEGPVDRPAGEEPVVDPPGEPTSDSVDDAAREARSGSEVADAVADESVAALADESLDEPARESTGELADAPVIPSVSTTMLLVNVVVTHGVFAVVLVGAAGLTDVPAAALGVDGSAWSTGWPAAAGGVALGLGLAGANAGMAATLGRYGIEHSEALREALAPDGPAGWATLLLLVLPIVAVFEELLFRAVLVGAAATATGLSPWLFVVLSSVAFAAGHGIQGRGGLLVTGLLGVVLAAAFVATNSLLLVVLAHYVVNAVEFVWKEALDGPQVIG